MRTKSIKVAFVAAIAFVSGITVFNSQKSELELSDIALANVEALASGENMMCPNGCYSNGDGCYCNGWFPYYREAGPVI